MRISIKLKFSTVIAAILIFTVSILSILVLRGIQNNQKKDYEIYLAQQVRTANTYIKQMDFIESAEDEEAFLQKNAQKLIAQLASINRIHATIYNMNGEKIVESRDNTKDDIKNILSQALKNQIAYQVVGNDVEYMAPLYGVNQIGVIQLHYSLEKNMDFYNDIKSLFMSIGAGVFIFSFMGAYLYFDRFSKSIVKLTKDILAVKRGSYNGMITLRRNDELGELSEGIYYMSSQIEESINKMEDEHEKLKQAIQKLKALEKQQKNFIGNITHEFKTPLTVIKTYMDLLDMYSDDPQLLQEAKVNIVKETQRLYEMVEKSLHLSSLQKYDFEFQCEKIDVKEILEEICSRMQGKAQKFNLSLVENLESGLVLGDKENLMHIFINLIDNAIKYNEAEGKIFVKSYTKNNKIMIEVADTGIGIPKEERDRIFEPFYTVNKARAKSHGGTGLGLSLVKELVERQKGTISLLDTKQKGATFLISFPAL